MRLLRICDTFESDNENIKSNLLLLPISSRHIKSIVVHLLAR